MGAFSDRDLGFWTVLPRSWAHLNGNRAERPLQTCPVHGNEQELPSLDMAGDTQLPRPTRALCMAGDIRQPAPGSALHQHLESSPYHI